MLPATLIKDAAYEACRVYKLSPPFKTGHFLVALQEERELYIKMQPQLMPPGAFGLCVAESARQYVIFYHSLSSLLHREATIWHELGHVFFDHVTPRQNKVLLQSAYGPQVVRPDDMRAPLSVYTNTAEDYEAELFSRTMLHYALGRNPGGYTRSIAATQRDPERASQLNRFLDELARR